MDAVHNLGHAKTIIMIAHRLSTVRLRHDLHARERPRRRRGRLRRPHRDQPPVPRLPVPEGAVEIPAEIAAELRDDGEAGAGRDARGYAVCRAGAPRRARTRCSGATRRRSAASSTTRCTSCRPSSPTTGALGSTASSSSTTARPTAAEYLAAQPDVMVVESAVRYFEEVDYAPAAKAKVRELRAALARPAHGPVLHRPVGARRRSRRVPRHPGRRSPGLTRALEAEGAEAAWG